jgi:hypothetical protein
MIVGFQQSQYLCDISRLSLRSNKEEVNSFRRLSALLLWLLRNRKDFLLS